MGSNGGQWQHHLRPAIKARPSPSTSSFARRPWTEDFRFIPRDVLPEWLCSNCCLSNWGHWACCRQCGAHPSRKTKDAQQQLIKKAQADERSCSGQQQGKVTNKQKKPEQHSRRSHQGKGTGGGKGSGATQSPKPNAKAAAAAPWAVKKKVSFQKPVPGDDEAPDTEDEAGDEEDQRLARHEKTLVAAVDLYKHDDFQLRRAQTEEELRQIREQRRNRWPTERQAKRATLRLKSAQAKTQRLESQEAAMDAAIAEAEASLAAAQRAKAE